MSKTVLWNLEPEKGAALFAPMQEAREHWGKMEELQKLRAERQAQLDALDLHEPAGPAAFADPEVAIANANAQAAAAALREIIAGLDGEIAKAKARRSRPKHAAEDLWGELVKLERRWKKLLAQAEHYGEGPYEANAQKRLKELEAKYKEYTGKPYRPAEPCGAPVTWEPPGPQNFEPLREAYKAATEAHAARNGMSEPDAYQQLMSRAVSPEEYAKAAGFASLKAYEEWKKKRRLEGHA